MSPALEVFATFLRLGLTSFGGPVAHLGYFRRAIVEKRGWLSEDEYAELVALCQFLPGPASSQVGFAIGLRRAGLAGGIAAFLGFTAPSAAIMIAAAEGVSLFSTSAGAALGHGLKLVAVVVVAHALIGMARALLRSQADWALAAGALAAMLIAASAWTGPAAILASGAAAALLIRPYAASPVGEGASAASPRGGDGWLAIGLLGLCAGLLLLHPPLAALAAVMAKAGALVFGGGHAVLPLLESDAVAGGFVSPEAFLAGYGAAQALPGPLFAFAAFIGAAHLGPVGGLVALAAIFAPGLALVYFAAPQWARMKGAPRARAFVGGASAAVVGVLAAAFVDPIAVGVILAPLDAVIAVAGFAALVWLKAPMLLVIAAVAAAGAAAALACAAPIG